MLQTRLVAKQVEEEVRPCKSSSFRRLEEGEGGHSVNSDCPPSFSTASPEKKEAWCCVRLSSSFKALEEQHPVHPPTVVVLSGFLSSNMLHIVDVNVNMREGIFK
jgi:hypothetical protein